MDAQDEAVVVQLPAGEDDEHSFTQEYLYAFATQGEITNHIRTQALGLDRDRQAEILERWALLQPVVMELATTEAGLAETILIEPVRAELQDSVAAYLADPLYQRQFNLPYEIATVEADKLIAYQRQINDDHVGRLMERFGTNPTAENVLRICVSPHREMEPVLHLELNPQSHSFSSRNSDVRFLGSFVRPLTDEDIALAEHGGVPTAAIIAFVGYGAPMVNVLAIGQRMILNNGFHRVIALRRLGVERIPVVVQRVTNPQLEVPPALGGLPRDYFVQHTRPPLVKDFFRQGFTVKFRVRERVKLVNLGVQAAEQEVPA